MMTIRNSHRATRFGRAAKYMLAGTAAAAFLGLSINAQAQTCTVGNWTDATGLADANAGTQGPDNRRYGGPCGLRVDFDGESRFLTYEGGIGETSYIARFYAFLDNAGADPVIIFSGEGAGEDLVQVLYNIPSGNDLTLRVFDAAGDANDLTFSGVGSGWHSIEFTWESGADATVNFVVNSEDPADDATMTIDTSGLSIDTALLGNVDGVTAGTVDYDDFDSRRSTRPGRLLIGDADDSGSVATGDLVSILSEINGNAFAPGQPDCDENGSIGTGDLVCVLTIINQ